MQFLEQENIVFDTILTDNPFLAKEGKIQVFDQYLETFFAQQKIQETWLLILDRLSLNDVLPFIKKLFKRYIILDAWSGIASFGKKLTPEYRYLEEIEDENCYFPFDERGFLKILKTEESSIVMLTDNEIPENIYESSDEELQIVDKALVEQPQFLSLLDPENPDLSLIGTGNHLEELIKLSQLLASREEKISLGVCWSVEVLSSSELQQNFKKAKKICIIIDHESTPFFQALIPAKNLVILSPDYKHITSISAEWNYTQAGFDAESLLKRSLALLK